MKALLLVLSFICATALKPASASEKGDQPLRPNEAELTSKTKYMSFYSSNFVKDDDPYRVQIVIADEREDLTPSHVSEDGQVIFLNPSAPAAADMNVLLRESAAKRLAHEPGT